MAGDKTREDDFRDFAGLLNKHGVDYMIIGAYATIYHTRIVRETKDIDFWIRKSEENAEKCAAAVKEFCGLEIPKEDLLQDKIFFIGQEPNRLDIFNQQGLFDFEKAWRNHKDGEFQDIQVHYISKEDLIRIKQGFDREQDRKDVVRLKRTGREL